MAVVWSQRTCPYLLGVLCLILSTLALATSLVVLFWVRQYRFQTLNIPSLNIGLWFMCSDDWVCFGHSFSSDKEYMHVTRGLHIAGVVGEVICVSLIFIINCRRQPLGHKADLAVSVVIFFSALVCVGGPMVFVAHTHQAVEELSYLRYDWAFGLSVGACALALLSALILLLSRRCGPGCGSSDDTKTQSAIDWHEDPSYSHSAQTGMQEDRGDDPYLHHPVYPNDLLYSHPQPLPLAPPGEQGHPSRVSSENIYTAYPNGIQERERSGEDVDWEMMAIDNWPGETDMGQTLSPSWREQIEERRYYSNHASGTPKLYGPEGEFQDKEPPPMMELSPFMLPRVVVRGYYEAGNGHPEYVML